MLLSHHCLLMSHFGSVQKPLATAGKKMQGLQDPQAWCSVAVSLGLAGDTSMELHRAGLQPVWLVACRVQNGQISTRC